MFYYRHANEGKKIPWRVGKSIRRRPCFLPTISGQAALDIHPSVRTLIYPSFKILRPALHLGFHHMQEIGPTYGQQPLYSVLTAMGFEADKESHPVLHSHKSGYHCGGRHVRNYPSTQKDAVLNMKHTLTSMSPDVVNFEERFRELNRRARNFSVAEGGRVAKYKWKEFYEEYLSQQTES